MIKNIYCPNCLEKDGLSVALEGNKCPQCNSRYFTTSGGLYGNN